MQLSIKGQLRKVKARIKNWLFRLQECADLNLLTASILSTSPAWMDELITFDTPEQLPGFIIDSEVYRATTSHESMGPLIDSCWQKKACNIAGFLDGAEGRT